MSGLDGKELFRGIYWAVVAMAPTWKTDEYFGGLEALEPETQQPALGGLGLQWDELCTNHFNPGTRARLAGARRQRRGYNSTGLDKSLHAAG
ncbi:hypothetical protein DPEC_G00350440 [Dallia pectoralis]|uniref:Uncharacterized protein n=1 Tax=Dallia pectoralis TaxID=75939 RepID=A0ACC2F1L9_DALPE|nr:hypothetical protein DPEC_G00350440 [Dallia pectoralis]